MSSETRERIESGFAPRMPVLDPVPAEEFLREPHGRCTIGAGWICFCASSGLSGAVLWGRLGRDAVTALLRVVSATHSPTSAPHPALLDGRRVESIDAGVFGAVSEHIMEERIVLARSVTRLTVIRPEGFAGIVAAGFFRVVPAPYQVDIVETVFAAQECLGIWAPSELFDVLDTLQGETCEMDPFLGEVIVFLRANVRDVSVAVAASRFQLSTRTFQRRLTELGTSFQGELDRVRVSIAKRLMLDDGISLATIAVEVGCASASHLTVLFRRVTGAAPSAWRARARPEGLGWSRIATP